MTEQSGYRWTIGRTLFAMILIALVGVGVCNYARDASDVSSDPLERQRRFNREQCIQTTAQKYLRVNVEPQRAREMAASECP